MGQEPPVEPLAPLAGSKTADVVVVGGGYAGMWTAWLLREAEPEARVVLLESGLCGHGPSGRNGGFVNSMWFSLPTMRERFGDAGAIGVARAAQAAVVEVGEWCRAHDVDAWYRRGGYIQVSTAPAWDGTWTDTVRACEELGEPDAVEVLSAGGVAGAVRLADVPRGRVLPGLGDREPGAARTGPAREAGRGRGGGPRALARPRDHRRPRRRQGAHGGRRRARGTRGHGRGRRAGGRAPLRRRLTLTSSHMVITEPVPELLEEIGWTRGECITDARHLLHYFRTTPDGRIAFGWGGGRCLPGARTHGHAEIDAEVATQVASHLVRFFPGLAGRRLDHAWGGPIDVSPSHVPFAGTLDGRVHYGFGFTGNGVGPSRMIAHALCSLALDRRDEHSRLAIVESHPRKVPPEPLRYIGGTIVRQALIAKEAAEEAGREPDPLAAFVAAIPERIGVQVGR